MWKSVCWKLVKSEVCCGCAGFLSGKVAGVLCRGGPGNCGHSWYVVDTGSPCPSSLFLSVSMCLSFAGLWVQGNWSGVFVQCPKRLEKLIIHPAVCFLVRDSLSHIAEEIPLDKVKCWPGGMRHTKWSCSSFPFCVVIFRFFVSLCCWNFLSGLSRLLGLCSQIAV